MQAEKSTEAPPAPKFCYLDSQLLGYLAMQAVRQSPYDCGPANLTEVLTVFAESVKKDMQTVMGSHYIELAGYQAVEDLYRKHLWPILAFRQWNLTKVEMDAGFMDPEDKDRPVKFGFTSRYSQPKADYDFIALDALVENIAHRCYAEGEESYAQHMEDQGNTVDDPDWEAGEPQEPDGD